MPLEVDAVYENGVLRPLQPLDLKEHEQVVVSVVKVSAPGRSSLAVEYIESVKKELLDAEPAPGPGRSPEAAREDSRIDGCRDCRRPRGTLIFGRPLLRFQRPG